MESNSIIGRKIHIDAFNKSLTNISTEHSSVLFYFGSGGVGKTEFIRYLEADLSNSTKQLAFNFATYDLKSSSNFFETLNALRKTLIDKYQVEFQLYEKGCIYHYQKLGDIAFSSYRIQETLKKSLIIEKAKKYLEVATGKLGDVQTIGKAAEILTGFSIEALHELSETSTVLRASKLIFDKWLEYRAKKAQRNYDESYNDLIQELEERQTAPQVDAVKELLPKLFARDVSDWLEETNGKLIIFLDTYEKLTGDETDYRKHEKLVYENRDVPVDWWIEDLLNNTKRVLWVITGRSNIQRIGDEFKITSDNALRLTALNSKFANKFLKNSGIEDEKIREGIIKLTGGYPIYLSTCVETYKAIIAKGEQPTISAFGKKREKIVQRLIHYMDEGARNITYRLCILGIWTNAISTEILGTLHEYNVDTYERVERFSFIFSQDVNFDDKKLFSFDRSIQKIFLDYFKTNQIKFLPILKQTLNAANKFFCNAFNDRDFKNIWYLRIWYELILRTTDDANELMTQYEENLLPIMKRFDISVIENIMNRFSEKILEQDTEPYAYFECNLAKIKLIQGKDTVALEYAESAYKKVQNKPVDAELKIYIMETLADVYKKLQRIHDEISLREKILADIKNLYTDSTNEKIIAAQNNFANALMRNDKREEALKIYSDIYGKLQRLGGQRAIKAAEIYADNLEKDCHFNDYIIEYPDNYEITLPIREKIAEFYQANNDFKNLIYAIEILLHNLKFYPKYSSFPEKLDEKILKWKKQLLHAREKVYGEFSKETIQILSDIKDWHEKENFVKKITTHLKTFSNDSEKFEFLRKLPYPVRHMSVTSEQIFQEFSSKAKKIIIDDFESALSNYENAVAAGNFLLDVATEISEAEENTLRQNLNAIMETHWLLNKNYEESVKELRELAERSNYAERLKLRKKILRLLTNKFPNAEAHPKIITAMNELADTFSERDETFDRAIKLHEEIVNRLELVYQHDDPIHEKIIVEMDKTAYLLMKHGNYESALQKLYEILRLLEEYGANRYRSFNAMKKIINFYEKFKHFSELNNSKLREFKNYALDFCNENFSESAPQTIWVMEKFAKIFDESDDYVDALDLLYKVKDAKIHNTGNGFGEQITDINLNIAYILHQLKKYDEELIIRLEIAHQNIFHNYDVAILLNQLGRKREAREVLRKFTKTLKKHYEVAIKEFGKESEEAKYVQDYLAMTFKTLGDTKSYEKYARHT